MTGKIVALATFILIVGFYRDYHVVGDAIAALSLMPILLSAFFFGVRGGIISAFILIPVMYYLYDAVAGQTFMAFLHNGPGIILSFVLVGGVGWLSDLLKRSRRLNAQVEQDRKSLELEIANPQTL